MLLKYSAIGVCVCWGEGGYKEEEEHFTGFAKVLWEWQVKFVHVLPTYGSLIHLSHMCFLLPFTMTCAFAENQLFLLLLDLSLEAGSQY